MTPEKLQKLFAYIHELEDCLEDKVFDGNTAFNRLVGYLRYYEEK